MKKIFLASIMVLASVGAFAHPSPYPHRHPVPGPYPHPTPYPQPAWCQVAAVDQYNRVIAYFPGNAPMCRDGLAHCNNQIRRQGWWGARCVILSNRW